MMDGAVIAAEQSATLWGALVCSAHVALRMCTGCTDWNEYLEVELASWRWGFELIVQPRALVLSYQLASKRNLWTRV